MALYDLVKGKVKDDSEKLSEPDDYQNAIAEALKHYSGDRPREIVADLNGAGVHDYPVPVGWCDGISIITAVEYPGGQVPEHMLDRRDWRLYRAPDGNKVRVLNYTPNIGETIRVTFTALHSEATVPAVDLEAVANLGASRLCRVLAAAYGQTSDSTINADVVNYRSKSGEFIRLADTFEKMYHDHLGIKPGDTTPAAMATAAPADGDRLRLTHPRPGGRRWN